MTVISARIRRVGHRSRSTPKNGLKTGPQRSASTVTNPGINWGRRAYVGERVTELALVATAPHHITEHVKFGTSWLKRFNHINMLIFTTKRSFLWSDGAPLISLCLRPYSGHDDATSVEFGANRCGVHLAVDPSSMWWQGRQRRFRSKACHSSYLIMINEDVKVNLYLIWPLIRSFQ